MRIRDHNIVFQIVSTVLFALVLTGCGLTNDWSFSVNVPSGSISANGKSTNTSLFDTWTLKVMADSIDLERHYKLLSPSTPDCTNAATSMAYLSRGEDNTRLTGEITGSITYSGNCTLNGQVLLDCDFKAPLVATRGQASNEQP